MLGYKFQVKSCKNQLRFDANTCQKQSMKKASFCKLAFKISTPTGNRTPVAAVKGRCPRPLDDGDFGAPGAIRTPDPLVRSQILYPTELRVHLKEIRIIGIDALCVKHYL